jgi:sugar phosphate isomerase/epimerase
VRGKDGRLEIAPPISNGVRRLDRQLKREKAALDPFTWVMHGIDVILARISWSRSRESWLDSGKQEASLDYLLEQMVDTTNELGAKLLVVYIPLSHQDQAPAALLKPVERLQVPFLDLSPILREYREGVRNPPLYIAGDGHPSVAGHRLISEAIISFVNQRTLLRR